MRRRGDLSRAFFGDGFPHSGRILTRRIIEGLLPWRRLARERQSSPWFFFSFSSFFLFEISMAREKANGFYIYMQAVYVLIIINHTREEKDGSMSSCFAGMRPDVKSREVSYIFITVISL